MKLIEFTWNKRHGVIFAFPPEIKPFLTKNSKVTVSTKVLKEEGDDAVIQTQFFVEVEE